MTRSLFDRPDIRFNRERRLKLTEGNDKQVIDSQSPAQVAFSEVQEVIDKATDLESKIDLVLTALTIPVSSDEVRSAVNRQDPASGGVYITYELYKRALAAKEDTNFLRASELRGSFDLSDPKQTDLQALMLSKKSGMKPEDASFIQSQASYLFALQMMQLGLQAVETEKQTVGKFPPGPEVAVTLTSIITSIAFLISYTDQTTDNIKRLLDNLGKGSSADIASAMKAAETIKFPEDSLEGLLIQSKTPSDYDLILEYSHRFLAYTEKIGYEPWLLISDVRAIRKELEYDIKNAHRYTPAYPTDPTFFDVISSRAHHYSDSLNHIATALHNQDVGLAQLCSITWLLKIPRAAIELLISIYKVFLSFKSLSIFNLLSVTGDPFGILWDVIHEVLELFSRTAKRLLCWFQRDPEIWGILRQCPPIAEMVDAAVTALEEIEGWLFQKIDKAVDYFKSKSSFIVIKAEVVLELRKIREMIAKTEYAVGRANNLAAEIDRVSRLDISKDVFKQAAKGIEVRFKEKGARLKDYVKRDLKHTKFISDDCFDCVDRAFADIDLPLIPFGTCSFETDGQFTRTLQKLGQVGSTNISEIQEFGNFITNQTEDL